MLTLELLKQMPPNTIFGKGEIENSPDGIYMTNSDQGKMLLWVAQRGGIYDWAIYIHWADRGIEYVIEIGDKVMNEKHIKKLVECTDGAFNMYRY